MISPSESSRTFLSALVFVSTVAVFAKPADAQVYQVLPQNSRPVPDQILPGQIINGERVITAEPVTNPIGATFGGPVRIPNQAVQTFSRNTRLQEPTVPTVRRDKIPRTVFPISPNNTEQSFFETPGIAESSIVARKTDQLGFPTAPTPADEYLMAEINAIRAQLGGGISKSLEGLELDPLPVPSGIGRGIEIAPAGGTSADGEQEISPGAMFEQELRSVISKQSQLPAIAPDIQPGISRLSGTPGSISNSQTNNGATLTTSSRIEELRASARELETLAGRLEAVQAYDAADRLRQHATSLWSQARQ